MKPEPKFNQSFNSDHPTDTPPPTLQRSNTQQDEVPRKKNSIADHRKIVMHLQGDSDTAKQWRNDYSGLSSTSNSPPPNVSTTSQRENAQTLDQFYPSSQGQQQQPQISSPNKMPIHPGAGKILNNLTSNAKEIDRQSVASYVPRQQQSLRIPQLEFMDDAHGEEVKLQNLDDIAEWAPVDDGLGKQTIKKIQQTIMRKKKKTSSSFKDGSNNSTFKKQLTLTSNATSTFVPAETMAPPFSPMTTSAFPLAMDSQPKFEQSDYNLNTPNSQPSKKKMYLAALAAILILATSVAVGFVIGTSSVEASSCGCENEATSAPTDDPIFAETPAPTVLVIDPPPA